MLWSCAFHPRGLQQIPVITSPHLLFIYSNWNYLWTLVPFAKSLLVLLTLIKLIHPAKWKVVWMPIPGSALFPGGNTVSKQRHQLILQSPERNVAAVIPVIEQSPPMPFKSCLAAAKDIWKKFRVQSLEFQSEFSVPWRCTSTTVCFSRGLEGREIQLGKVHSLLMEGCD